MIVIRLELNSSIIFPDKPAEDGIRINVSGELLRAKKASFLEFSLDHIEVIDA